MLQEKVAASRAERPEYSSEEPTYEAVGAWWTEIHTLYVLRGVDRRNVERQRLLKRVFKVFWERLEREGDRDLSQGPSVTLSQATATTDQWTKRLHNARARGAAKRFLRAQSGKSG